MNLSITLERLGQEMTRRIIAQLYKKKKNQLDVVMKSCIFFKYFRRSPVFKEKNTNGRKTGSK